MFKFFVTIIVLIVAGGALWWAGLLSSWIPSIPAPSSVWGGQTSTTTATSTPQQQQQAVNDLPTSPTDASDQALSQDTAALDIELKALDDDSASVQNSLNDKPVTQEY